MAQSRGPRFRRSMADVGRALAVAGAIALAGWGLPASGIAQVADQSALKALRVCQDPNNMPFSNEKGEGIENKIAELFASQLKVPVEYFSFPQRLGFVRN